MLTAAGRCGVWLLALAGSCWAGPLQLRIETGGHHAPIRAVATDAAGRLAVTAAEDKTARVWDLVQGTLLLTFRPPAAAGNDGKLFAATLAPDGNTFAVAGWSAGNDVYLVSRSDGRIVHRITGLPDVITSLAFSPDGRQLAAGLWGRHGVRLFAAADGWRRVRELAGDADYGGEVHALAWGPQQVLFASAADGAIRRYQVDAAGLRLALRSQTTDIGTPYGLAPAPDGQRLAVGSSSQAGVALLDSNSLRLNALLAAPAVRSGRALQMVSWSADGERVTAGGSWIDDSGRFAACSWQVARPADATCRALAADSITGLVALPAGSLLHVSAMPSIGVIDARGQDRFRRDPQTLDFRQGRSRFRLAPDGSAIAFPLSPAGGEAGIDLLQLAWVTPARQWNAARSQAGGSTVEGWFERPLPVINGRSVALDSNEQSLAASVAADGERVLLATSQKIRSYSRAGQLQWQSPVPATPWQVNLSDNGRWVVAGFSDGSIRWYDAAQGREQLALLPLGDRRRWMAWTPSGHFATSPGGESLLGWQIDHGAERAADFYPLAKFRDMYYRPELIGALFSATGPPAAATAQTPAPQAITARLPPLLRIVAPDRPDQVAGERLTLQLQIQSPPDAPATALSARINGQRIELPALVSLKPQRQPSGDLSVTLPLTLPPGDSRVLLFAHNRHGVSDEAALQVSRPAAPEPPPSADYRPALYVLAIGISAYRDTSIRLEFAAKDSADLSHFLQRQEGGIYRKVVVRLLNDAAATRDGVLDGLEWIRRELTARDVAVIFLAGHGVNDADGTYYFLPQDAELKRLKRSAVIFTEIRNTLVSLAGKVLFFIDTCHSGNVLGTGSRAVRNDTTAVINELAGSDNGVIVFAASTGRQYALESSDWGNGAFTKAILEGLGGKADFGNSGRITHKMLDLYVSERVKRLTDGAQSPVTIVPNGVPDFPLVLGRQNLPAR